MAWISPKLDWLTNPVNPTATDMARIEGNTDFLKTDIETKKGLIVDAVNTMGQTATLSNTHSELAGKIVAISSDASATVGQVISGATFYQGGVKRTGTMVNRGNVSYSLPINGSYTIPQGYHAGAGSVTQSIPTKSAQTFTPSTVNQTITVGQYLSGTQTILGDADLISANIKSGVNIFGVAGTIRPLTTEKKWATGTASFSQDMSVSGLGFAPSVVVAIGKADGNIDCFGVGAKVGTTTFGFYGQTTAGFFTPTLGGNNFTIRLTTNTYGRTGTWIAYE